MVIQRRNFNLVHVSGGGGGFSHAPAIAIAPLEHVNQISSSEEEEESSSSNNSWNNDRSELDYSEENCPATVLRELNARLTKSQRSENGVAGSLELLRTNLQSAFEKEIDEIVTRYKEKFFQKAMWNLRKNLGEDVVRETDLLAVLHKMVEMSANQYKTSSVNYSSHSLPPVDHHPGSIFDLRDGDEDENTSLDEIPTSLPVFNAAFHKYSPFPVWKHSSTVSEAQRRAEKRKRDGQVQGEWRNKRMAWSTGKGGGAVEQQLSQPSSFDNILHSTLTRPSNTLSSFRAASKIAWNTETVDRDTKFVLDAEVRKFFGGTDRVAMRHPELIRYALDLEDVDWLIEEKLVSEAERHVAIELFVREEVNKVKRKEEEVNWKEEEEKGEKEEVLKGFKVPEFMFRKMQTYFKEVNLRSQKERLGSGYFETVVSGGGGGRDEERNKSQLSSSHATLSALLANCSSTEKE